MLIFLSFRFTHCSFKIQSNRMWVKEKENHKYTYTPLLSHSFIHSFTHTNRIKYNVFTSKRNFTVRWPINIYRYSGKKVLQWTHIDISGKKKYRTKGTDSSKWNMNQWILCTFCTIVDKYTSTMCVCVFGMCANGAIILPCYDVT